MVSFKKMELQALGCRQIKIKVEEYKMDNKLKWLKLSLWLWVLFWSTISIFKYFSNMPEIKNSLGEFFGIIGLITALLIGLLPAMLLYFIVRWLLKKRTK